MSLVTGAVSARLEQVSGLTNPRTPRIQPLDQSGMWANDGLSIDQSGTMLIYEDKWRETSKKIQPTKSQ